MAYPTEIPPKYQDMIKRHYNENWDNRKIAVKIVKEEGITAATPEIIRKYVALYRTELTESKINRENTSITKSFDFDPDSETITVPGSWYEEQPTYEIPHGYNSTLIINDIHVPFHDVTALRAALKYGRDRGIDSIYINGDLMDFYALSFFSKDPKYRKFKAECEAGEAFFQGLRATFPGVKIWYKLGNHEERFERYLRDKAEDLDGLVTIESLMNLKEYGIEVIDGRHIVRHGKLYILHGHEIRVSSALVNIARTVRLRTSVNTLVGHHHKTQEDYNKDLADQVTGSWAVGCLCGLRPDYMPVNNWNHGFAHLESDNSSFQINNKKIVNGRIV